FIPELGSTSAGIGTALSVCVSLNLVGRGSRTVSAFFQRLRPEQSLGIFARGARRAGVVVLPWIHCFALGLARLFDQASFMIDVATRYTAARQLFGLSRYNAGQFQAPCSACEDVSEPRPTNPKVRIQTSNASGYETEPRRPDSEPWTNSRPMNA